jgi:hypothetical protein
MFQKELYSGVPNVTVWRVLRKRLHLKAYKLSIVQHLDQSRIVVSHVTLRCGNFMKNVHLDRNAGQRIIQSKVLYENLRLCVQRPFKIF